MYIDVKLNYKIFEMTKKKKKKYYLKTSIC